MSREYSNQIVRKIKDKKKFLKTFYQHEYKSYFGDGLKICRIRDLEEDEDIKVERSVTLDPSIEESTSIISGDFLKNSSPVLSKHSEISTNRPTEDPMLGEDKFSLDIESLRRKFLPVC